MHGHRCQYSRYSSDHPSVCVCVSRQGERAEMRMVHEREEREEREREG